MSFKSFDPGPECEKNAVNVRVLLLFEINNVCFGRQFNE